MLDMMGDKWLAGDHGASCMRAVEHRAVTAAIEHFEAAGWTVEDVGDFRPYDLHCTKDGRTLHVEVKGTTSAGEKVILTRNEASPSVLSSILVSTYPARGTSNRASLRRWGSNTPFRTMLLLIPSSAPSTPRP